MAEFIITSEQLKIAVEAIAQELDKPITEVKIRGDRLEKLVRCKDCKGYRPGELYGWCSTHMTAIPREDGFCAWGKRKEE